MLISNLPIRRCLILSNNSTLLLMLTQIFRELNFETDFTNNRKTAISNFLQGKHILIGIDAEFLPRFPFRLVQIFKIAHRIPGVIIFKESNKDITGFNYLRNCNLLILEPPYTKAVLCDSIQTILTTLVTSANKFFLRNLTIQIGVVLPIIALVVYLLIQGSVVP